MAEQLSMFEPPKRKSGLLYLPKYLTIADQKDLLNDLRTVVRQSPLFTPTMSSGAPFRYKMTNIGDLGWNSDRQGYRYESKHPVTGQPYPEIPSSLRSMIDDLSGKFGEKIRPDAVLLNWYSDGAKLGLHVDSSEKVSKPVVSLSLGDRGVFAIDTTGSRDRNTAMKNLERINANSGDAIVFGGDLRNAYHAVERIDAGTAPPELGMKNSGRINLTARQVNKISGGGFGNPIAKLAKGFAMREGARILAKQLGADEQQQQAIADTITVANVAASFADNSRVNNMAANKKINSGSLSTSVKESKPQKLTTDTLYKYLQMMGGEPVIVKPDGGQATKGKFAFGQDVGLNNEFTKLPEIHVRFDDPKISSLVAKELATGELTVGMQRNPQTGEVETTTKKFEPIPSRGNTQLRGYRLGNDPTGDYLAFNKPEEAYKAPKSLKELQADIRKSYQTFGLKPDATIADLEAAVMPIMTEAKNSPELRDRLQTVLTDMQSRQVLEPVATLEPVRSPVTPAPISVPEQTLDTPSDAWKFPQQNERKLPNFYPQMASGDNPLGTGATVQSTYDRAKSAYEGYQDFGYAPSDRKFPTFREMVKLAESEGVKGDEAIKAYIKGKQNAPLIDAGVITPPELPLTARLGQEYISPKTGKVGTVESVGKKGVKLNVDGQVVPLEYQTLEKLKYTGNKGYGFAAPAALRPMLGGFAGGTIGGTVFKQLAKAAGLSEEQQNQAAATGGLIGSLTGSALTNVPANTKLRMPTAGEFATTMMGMPQSRSAGARLFDLASSQSGALSMEQRQKALDFNQQYDSGAIAKRGSSLSESEDLGLGRAMTPEEFARKFPDKAKDFGIEVKPQAETVFPKYEPKLKSKEPKKVVLQDFQVGQEVVSTGSKGFQYRVTDVRDGQVTFENYQGKSKTFPVEFASKGVAPVEYRQPLQLGEYDYRVQRTPKEAIPSLPKDALPTPAKDAYFKPVRKVPFEERYLQNKGYKVTYNDPVSGVMEVKPPDLVPVNGKLLKLNEYLAASKEWRTNALAATGALRDLDYQIPLTDKQGRTALEQALFEANNSLPPAPSRADFMVDPPKQKLKEFLSRGSKPFVPESMSNVDNLKQAMSQAEALGDIESQMNIAKQLEKAQSKRVVKKVSGGGFNKAKQAIAQTIQNVAETALDVVYQPSKSQPKSSNFIAESAVESAAKSSGATTAQVKAAIASQRASGIAPDLDKATEVVSAQQSQQSPARTEVNPFDDPARRTAAFDLTNRAFKQNISTSSTRSLNELKQTTRSPQQFTFNPPMSEPVASTRAKTPSWELPAADFVPLPIPNKVDPRLATAQRVGDRLTQVATTPYTGNVGRIGGTLIKGFDYGSDITQAAQTFSQSANRGESAGVATARATASVGSAYGVAAITNALPLPAPVKLALTVGGSLAAAYGADKAIDSMVGRNEAKEGKYIKDLSKLNLAGDPDSEMLQPFGKAGDRDYLRAYGNSLVNVATLNMSTAAPELGRSLANLTNSQAIANARLASERDTSIKAGMDAKSNRSIAYEDLGDGKSRAFLRDRGFTSTESRVLALQNLANESGYEVPRTGKFNSKTLDALEKLGYSQSQISEYIQGKTKAIGKPRQIEKAGSAVRQVLNRNTEKVTGQQLSQALAAERKSLGLKYGETLDQGQVDSVFRGLAGRSLTDLRRTTKVGGVATQSALRLGTGLMR